MSAPRASSEPARRKIWFLFARLRQRASFTNTGGREGRPFGDEPTIAKAAE